MSTQFYTLVRRIDSLRRGPCNDYTLGQIRSVIDVDADVKKYFFSELDAIDWFRRLHSAGYFGWQENPSEIEDPDNPGYFRVPVWPALSYLEKVAAFVNENDDPSLANDLISIIEYVSNPPEQDELPDNPITWSHFVKILAVLPNRFVTHRVLRHVPNWLDSKFNMTIPDADICRDLFPKFITGSSRDSIDISKAAIILDGITTLKPLPRAGDGSEADSDTERIQLVTDDYWVHESLIRGQLARKFGGMCSEDSVLMVADRLFEAVSYQFTNKPLQFALGSADERRWFKICCSTALDFNIEVFSADPGEGEIAPLQSLTGERLLTADRFKEFIDTANIVDSLTKRLISGENITGLYFSMLRGVSHYSIKSLDDRENEHDLDAEGVLTLILLEMLLGRAESEEDNFVASTRSILGKLLYDKYRPAVFTRIVLYVLNRHWHRLNGMFWELLDKAYSAYYFTDSAYEAELYAILTTQSKAGQLADDKQVVLERIIEGGPQIRGYDERQIAYWKQSWYSALTSIDRFESKYKVLFEITKTKEEVGSPRSYFRVGHGDPPLKVAELLEMTNEQIAAFCRDFRNSSSWRAPNVNALAEALSSAVLLDPKKFVDDLDPFLEISYLFNYKLLFGLREAWKNQKALDWQRILGFVLSYTEKAEVWSDAMRTPGDDWEASHGWIIGEIAWLLQDGTVDDNWAMPAECHNDAIKILKLIFSRFEAELPVDDFGDDPVNSTLNTTYGKLLTALIYLALRIARLDSDSQADHSDGRWNETLKELFEKTVRPATPHAYVLIGQYLPQFLYLDQAWTEAKRDSFISLRDEDWKLFMYGYMFGNHQYATYYSKMIPHYKRGMGTTDISDKWQELFLDHIALGYMAGLGEFGQSATGFVGQLIDPWRPSQLLRVVQVVYRIPRHEGEASDTEPKDPGERFLSLWGAIYNRLQLPSSVSALSDAEKALLSELCKLTMWMPELSDEYTCWLRQAAPWIDTRHNSSQFLEQLCALANRGSISTDERAKHLGKILTAMLKNSVPYYKEEHIKDLVATIYESSESDTLAMANLIVDKYARAGYHFLREIWESNNPPEEANDGT